MIAPTLPATRQPLLGNRRAAVGVALVAAVLFAAMAVWLHDTARPTGADDAVAGWLFDHTGTLAQHSWLASALLAFTLPAVTIGIIVVVGLVALVRRRWDVVLLAAVGPAVGLLLESHVLKPAINRKFGLVQELSQGAVPAGYGFPSGHETGLVSTLTLLMIVVLRTAWSRRDKLICLAVAVAWAALGAVGLVRGGYHYFTDTWGGITLAVAVMIATALALDVIFEKVSSPAGRGPSRTARAA